MRIIDRVMRFMHSMKMNAHTFERRCRIANGYLGKQLNGRGTLGSDIIARIYTEFNELNLAWLIAGEGEMVKDEPTLSLVQEDRQFYSKDEKIQFLSERAAILEQALIDKEKIIALLEADIKKLKLQT